MLFKTIKIPVQPHKSGLVHHKYGGASAIELELLLDANDGATEDEL